ncbi:anti-sigma factor [Methylobacterium sp. NMS14P]|uniref:NepR family anti-sigma factor n=1 Tax=Methylobacterium sp. NMS14P TaxID=2894310 RepID=UPI00235965B1|nr:NepR family anti-sigma factor [Methylobacterium sp. NMS14P]WCS24705.1 anti-sigma factor [Methylobacterium sp. NMS14P]
MAYVEPQHNAAVPTSATRGVLMVDQGKEAGLRARDPHAEIASDRSSAPENSPVDAAVSDQPDRARSRNGLSDQTRNRIAAQLRAMYDTVTQQPVPDRFAELIARLDGADRKA